MRLFNWILGCALALTLSPAVAAEENPAFQMAKIPAGSYSIYELKDGGHVTLLYLGKRGEEYVIEARDGETPDGKLNYTYFVDELGQRKRLLTSNNEFTYRPHFCSRTMGSCRFRVKNHSSGRWFDLQRKLKRDGNNRYSYVLYESGQIFETGSFEPGPYGVPLVYAFQRRGKDESGTLKAFVTPE